MIKKFLNPGDYPRTVNIGLFLLRAAAGILMLTHGAGKVMMLIGDDPIKFGDPVGIGPAASLVLAAFAEFACSLLLIFGAATRFAVIPLIVTMLVAGLIVHAGDAFRVKELAFLYLSIFITIAFTGSGKFSVDNLIYKKIDNQNN